jgi:hypothetical protein
MVLAVVDLHGPGVDMRLKGVKAIRKVGKLKSHKLGFLVVKQDKDKTTFVTPAYPISLSGRAIYRHFSSGIRTATYAEACDICLTFSRIFHAFI